MNGTVTLPLSSWLLVIALSVCAGAIAGIWAMMPRARGQAAPEPELGPGPPHTLLAGPRRAGRFPADESSVILWSDQHASMDRLDAEIASWNATDTLPQRWRH